MKKTIYMLMFILLIGVVYGITYDDVSVCQNSNLTNNSVYNIVDGFNVTEDFCFYGPEAVNITFDCGGGQINTNGYDFVFYPWNAGSEGASQDMGDIYYRLQNCVFDTSDIYVFSIRNSSSKISLYFENNDFAGSYVSLFAPVEYLYMENNENVFLWGVNVGDVPSSTGDINSGLFLDNTFVYMEGYKLLNTTIENNIFNGHINMYDDMTNIEITNNSFDQIFIDGDLYNIDFTNNTFTNQVSYNNFFDSTIENNIFNGNLYVYGITENVNIVNNEFVYISFNTLSSVLLENNIFYGNLDVSGVVINTDFTNNDFGNVIFDTDIEGAVFDSNTFDYMSFYKLFGTDMKNNVFNGNIGGYRVNRTTFNNNDFYGRLYTSSRFEHSIIKNNRFHDINQDDNIMPYSRNVTIIHNSFNVSDLVLFGFSGYNSAGYNISYNTFTDCGVYFSYVRDSVTSYNNFTNPNQGLPFYWGAGNTNLTISHNRFTDMGNRNCLGDCDSNPDVYNAVSFNNFKVVSIQHTTNSLFEHNYFDNISGSFRIVTSATGNTIRYNNFVDLVFFEFRSGGNNNIIHDNNITSTGNRLWGYPSTSGIDLRDVFGNLIYDNIVTGNFLVGMRSRFSSYNNIVENNFINISLTQSIYDLFNNNSWWAESAIFVGSDTSNNNNFSNNTGYITSDINHYGILDKSSNTNRYYGNLIYGGDNSTDVYSNDIWICNTFDSLLYGSTNWCGEPILTSINLLPTTVSPQNQMVGSCSSDSNSILYYEFYKNDILHSYGNESVLMFETLSVNLGAELIIGDEWYFRCNSIDDDLKESGWSQSSTRTVVPNQIPIVQASLVGPLYDVEDTLPVYCSGTDLNDDNLLFTYRVYRENLLYVQGVSGPHNQGIGNITMTTITNTSDFVIGEEWYVECKAFDGYNESDFVNSSVLTVIKNSRPPTISYIYLYPLIIFDDSVIYSTGFAIDPNFDDLTYNHTLYVNDVGVETQTEFVSYGTKSNVSFSYNTLSINDTITIGLVVFDGEFITNETNSSTFIVRDFNNPPTTNVRVSPNIYVGDDDNILGYCSGVDIDGDSVNFEFIWYQDGIPIKSGNKITGPYFGHTSGIEYFVDTLSKTLTTQDSVVTFSCRAYDWSDYSEYTNVSVYIYQENNFIPEIRQVYISPSSGGVTQVFNLSVRINDRDGTQIQVEYRLNKNGRTQSTTTSSFFTVEENVEKIVFLNTLSDTKVGDVYYLSARAYDGIDYSDWKYSNVVTITNTPPIIQTAQIISLPYENTTLESECSAIDVDDQTIVFQKMWFKDDSYFDMTESILSGFTQKDEEWIVSCRAFDGITYSSWLNSSSVTIIDTSTPPTLSNIELLGEDGLLKGRCSVSDIEGDKINYTVMFYNNSILKDTQIRNNMIQGLSQEFLYYTTLVPGENWSFYCKGEDLDGYVDGSTSLVIPGLVFNHRVSSIDILQFVVEWTTNADVVLIWLNDVYLTNTTLSRYTFSGLTPNMTYNVKLQPVKDGFYGSIYNFNVTTKQTDNNKPIVESVSIVPSVAYTNNVLQGYCNASDIDNFYIFYSYKWYVDDVLVDSGVTTLKERNKNVFIDVLPSSNFVSNNTVKFSCIANDGISSSIETFTNITILNTPQEITDVFVTINESRFDCSYNFYDIDGDVESDVEYVWFKNDVSIGNLSYISSSGIDITDNLKCQIKSTTDSHIVYQNSSSFIVGDFESPVISSISVPSIVYTDTSYQIKVVCSDNVGVAIGYPRIRFIDPNFYEQEYPIFYDSNDLFSRYLTFPVAGTYTDIEFVCKDGNGNSNIEKYVGVITSRVRETVVAGGGSPPNGGVSTTGDVFKLNPNKHDFVLTSGTTRIVEFEVINLLNEDLSVTAAIQIVGDTPGVYSWMNFEGDLKAITFDVQRKGSLSTGSKFIRYYLRVPSNIEAGTYQGVIQLNANNKIEQYIVNIEVKEGSSFFLLSFLNYELFEIPFTESPTGMVITEGVVETIGKPFKVWMLLIMIIGIIVLFMMIRKIRAK